MTWSPAASSPLEEFEDLTLGTLPLRTLRYYPERWNPDAATALGVAVPENLARARPKRLTEYLAGRLLAQQFLRKYGCDETVGRNSESRAPVWPAGFVGSITHSRGLAACCVLPQTEAAGVGIDLECWLKEDTAARVAERIWTPAEAEVLLGQGWDSVSALTLVFSAKESLFKALYPLCHQFFGFDAARICGVTAEGMEGKLEVVLEERLGEAFFPGFQLTVEYRELGHHVLTGLAVPSESHRKSI